MKKQKTSFKLSPFLFSLILSLIFVFSLDTSYGREIRPSHHFINQPILENSPFQWIGIDERNFPSVARSLSNMIIPDILDKNHPITLRMQYWVEEIDKNIRKQNPELLKVVPKPLLKIINSKMVNAWVSAIPVCLEKAVHFSNEIIEIQMGKIKNSIGNEKINYVTSNDLLVDFDDSDILSDYVMSFEGPKPNSKCIPSSNLKNITEFIKFFNEKEGNCKLSYSKEKGALILSGKLCNIRNFAYSIGNDSEDKTKTIYTGSKTSRFNSTSNIFIVTTGLINAMKSEGEVVSIIAHELGHYYRAHVTNHKSKEYNYFYTLEESPSLEKPLVHPDNEDLIKEMNEVMSIDLDSSETPKEQRIRKENFMKRVVEEHLGYYTAEQEADDFSLEQISNLGLNPTVALDSMMKLTELRYKADKEGFLKEEGISPAEFKKLLANKMIDKKTGQYKFIPMGDLKDIHHHPLFRIFNFTREIELHHYPVDLDKEIKIEGWSAIKKSASELLKKVRIQPMF